jgi:antitoxin (DNA-binding transcriptional repressor) of toxin-antitoxin stability system
MKHIPVEEAKARLPELIDLLQGEEGILLTENGKLIAELTLPRPFAGGGGEDKKQRSESRDSSSGGPLDAEAV